MQKNSINAYLSELIILIYNCLMKGVLPNDLKLTNITAILKKDDSLNKENYRPAGYNSYIQNRR